MCILDDVGEYVFAITDWLSPLCDVVIGVAIGLQTTLQWIFDLQFDNVDFSLDSQQALNSFHANIDDHSEFGCIINTCR